MQDTFSHAQSFNQDLSNWDYSQTAVLGIVSDTNLSVENYDRLLAKLAGSPSVTGGGSFNGLSYCDSFSRNILLQNGYIITGDSLATNCAQSTISGIVTYDLDGNGCNSSDPNLENIGIRISNASNSLFVYTNNLGNYSIELPDGVYIASPIIDLGAIQSTPTLANLNTSGQSLINQDFCLTAQNSVDDLEIDILPVEDARPGFDTEYKIVYKNNGSTILSGSLQLYFQDNFMNTISTSPMFDSSTANTMTWNYANLLPYESREIDITFNLNPPTHPTFPLNSNDILNFSARISPSANDINPSDNSFDLQQIVVNSFDPNDKTCIEGNVISPSMVGDYVHYRIRFENEGTASAITVRIEDYLDTSVFDISSFVPLSSSHDYVASITEGNKLEFLFENINLPFTAPASQGYVFFKIRTLNTLGLGDFFSNQAGIYFDLNFPIITNLETTAIDVAASSSSVLKKSFRVFPNPASSKVTIDGENEAFAKAEIYTLTGQRIIISSKNVIDIDGLETGVYLLRIFSNSGSQESMRLVKQ
jgi:uncharacterized repeat protein (TIGR01451 family)